MNHRGTHSIDATRDAANRWLFPDLGDRRAGVRSIWVAASSTPSHFVDVTDTLDLGVASLREHRAYLDGLDDDAVDPDQLLRESARAAGESTRCAYAVTFQRFPA